MELAMLLVFYEHRTIKMETASLEQERRVHNHSVNFLFFEH